MNRFCALGALLLPLLLAQAAAIGADKFLPVPEVTLRLIDPAEPRLLLTNTSQAEAEGIDYWIKLWNVDNLADDDPLLMRYDSVAVLRPRETAAPIMLFEAPEMRAKLKRGDRVVGAVGVHCRTCARGHSYRVYITYGESGWFADVERASGRPPMSPRGHDGEVLRGSLLKEALLAWTGGAEHTARIPIAPLEP